MHVLIVNGHPEARSFGGALSEVAAAALREAGHTVEVSDLYRQGFKAVADRDDFAAALENPDYFRLDREQTHAHKSGTLAPDIVAEQEKLRRADLLILQYPMWWFGMPAIMKGWVDRVFTRGFAYLPGRKHDTGLMSGKTALVSVTTGTSADTYAPDGIDGALLSVLWPVHNGILRYCGFEVVAPIATHAAGRLSAHERARLLADYAEYVGAVDDQPRLFFHPRDDYGANERLLPGVAARSGVQRNV